MWCCVPTPRPLPPPDLSLNFRFIVSVQTFLRKVKVLSGPSGQTEKPLILLLPPLPLLPFPFPLTYRYLLAATVCSKTHFLFNRRETKLVKLSFIFHPLLGGGFARALFYFATEIIANGIRTNFLRNRKYLLPFFSYSVVNKSLEKNSREEERNSY